MQVMGISSEGSDIHLHLESEDMYLFTMLVQSLDLGISKALAHRAIEELGLYVVDWGVMYECSEHTSGECIDCQGV